MTVAANNNTAEVLLSEWKNIGDKSDKNLKSGEQKIIRPVARPPSASDVCQRSNILTWKNKPPVFVSNVPKRHFGSKSNTSESMRDILQPPPPPVMPINLSHQKNSILLNNVALPTTKTLHRLEPYQPPFREHPSPRKTKATQKPPPTNVFKGIDMCNVINNPTTSVTVANKILSLKKTLEKKPHPHSKSSKQLLEKASSDALNLRSSFLNKKRLSNLTTIERRSKAIQNRKAVLLQINRNPTAAKVEFKKALSQRYHTALTAQKEYNLKHLEATAAYKAAVNAAANL